MLVAERGAALNTVQAYRRDLDDYFNFLGQSGVAPDKAVTKDVREFVRSLSRRNWPQVPVHDDFPRYGSFIVFFSQRS